MLRLVHFSQFVCAPLYAHRRTHTTRVYNTIYLRAPGPDCQSARERDCGYCVTLNQMQINLYVGDCICLYTNETDSRSARLSTSSPFSPSRLLLLACTKSSEHTAGLSPVCLCRHHRREHRREEHTISRQTRSECVMIKLRFYLYTHITRFVYICTYILYNTIRCSRGKRHAVAVEQRRARDSSFDNREESTHARN